MDITSPKPLRTAAFIGIGSNMGDPVSFCRYAVRTLGESENCRITGLSRLYRTAPVDYLDQDWFVNGVIRVETVLPPDALLDRLQDIEQRAGRDRSGVRFGPRTLDMDILLYGNDIIQTERLTVPHPRMNKRRFVLEPLCDIDSTIEHPTLRVTIRRLLESLDKAAQPLQCMEETLESDIS